ncbi:LPS export ABC transporter periplasmic protein LptC [Qipengyuania sp. MTN3-11]|uniref:LPS export ABC transporter periplasmic protein LptC n=1 Tax=Qipengyuania sp. MTN3-11 TaxID=3056557 RepID=UPI0036F1AE04
MASKRRIETEAAAQRRSRRQHFAAPGGSHDRLVKLLAAALPMAVGVIAALMVITPLSPRGEVSFLLDRDKVATIDERLRVDNALYRGQDNRGRPFSLTADEAVQRSSAEGIVRLDDLIARLLLDEGPAQLDAGNGAYDIEDEIVTVNGAVRMRAADGYSMLLRDVAINLATKRAVGAGGVSGAVPAGTFSANRLEVDLDQRTVALAGDARMRMIPGQLNSMRMP